MLERRVEVSIDGLQVAPFAHLGQYCLPLTLDKGRTLISHLTPNIEPEACLRLVDGDHMGLEDALPRVLLPPVVVMVLSVHHHSHWVVGGATGAKSENTLHFYSTRSGQHFQVTLSPLSPL